MECIFEKNYFIFNSGELNCSPSKTQKWGTLSCEIHKDWWYRRVERKKIGVCFQFIEVSISTSTISSFPATNRKVFKREFTKKKKKMVQIKTTQNFVTISFIRSHSLKASFPPPLHFRSFIISYRLTVGTCNNIKPLSELYLTIILSTMLSFLIHPHKILVSAELIWFCTHTEIQVRKKKICHNINSFFRIALNPGKYSTLCNVVWNLSLYIYHM